MKKPRHERVKASRMSPENQPLRVRILGPTKVFATEDVNSIRLNLFDGVMLINRRYSSVIEKLKEGEIRLNLAYPTSSGSMERRYSVSSGWVIVAHNMCELLVKSCEEIN